MSLSSDPRLRQALEESRRQTRDAVRDLRALTAQTQAEQREFRKEQERSGADRATDARRGALGPAMQRVQERIDRRQTTWNDVVSGADTHPSAVAVRRDIEQGLAEFRRLADQDPEVIEAQIAARAAAERLRGASGPGAR
ncbi:hypothetical protein G7072_16375 [Nocardioides sp. HDW12B]|uniref:hypothetical protein n=1 Tax=Nocardioides sp. HDW12B TaxID=2714939 RepID=UPI001409CF0D|nr:hypothetical protein [Nocardioides sp. HDW12B]QIK67713.1 hypothetical protein G7072_16375 [Nocardioides sp. HDW12B]